MATSETARSLTSSDLSLVDVDSHLGESKDDLIPYIENKAIQRLVEGVDSDAQYARKIFSSTRTTPEFNQTKAGAKGSQGKGLVHEVAKDAKTKLEVMEEFDIECSILSPGKSGGLASVNHDQTAVALASAYNEWVADNFHDVHEGLKVNVLIAHQKPNRAAEEIDRWASEDSVVGVQLPASGLIPPAGHHWYHPIYEAAQDHDLPIVMHSGNSTTSSVFPVQRQWAETFIEDHLFTFPVESMWHMNSLMFQGIPEQFPNLEFVLQEAGVEWLPWMMWRMDDHYLQNSQDVPFLNQMPSEYIKDLFYFATQPLGHTDNPKHIAQIIEMAGGPDTIMYSSDHPHPDFDPPEELLNPLQTQLDEKAIRRIMGETAKEVFSIGG